jgi:putative tricarboxylic transport membrane protein
VLLITFLAPLLAKFALKFGPAEFFAVQLLTFCSFVGMSKEPPAKTLAAMMLGFALAAVGMDTVTGQLRMTFGQPELLKGFDFLIAVIGLFGIGEILLTMEEGLAFKGKSARITARWCCRPGASCSSTGSLPALGRDRLLDGHHARRRHAGLVHELRHGAAHVEEPGLRQGRIEGVVAPETAAHAAGTSRCCRC